MQIIFVIGMAAPMLLSTCFFLYSWFTTVKKKKWWHVPVIVCQLWPQTQSLKTAIFLWRGEEGKDDTGKVYNDEDILKNLPQATVECIGKLKTRITRLYRKVCSLTLTPK